MGLGSYTVEERLRGAQYHARSWAGICEEHGVARSMSRKGRSPDNARMEGFFGLLKREFLRCRDWEGTSLEELCAQLDEWLTWHNEGRRTIRLGWKSPMEYRRSLGLSPWALQVFVLASRSLLS